MNLDPWMRRELRKPSERDRLITTVGWVVFFTVAGFLAGYMVAYNIYVQ